MERQISGEPSPLEQVISREEELAMTEALSAIPAQYRLPLVLFYAEQRTVEDIADLLEISEQNAKTRLWRGRRLLQASLLERTLPRMRFRRGEFAAAVVAALAAGSAPNAEAVTRSRPGGSWLPRAGAIALSAALGIGGYRLLAGGQTPVGHEVSGRAGAEAMGP